MLGLGLLLGEGVEEGDVVGILGAGRDHPRRSRGTTAQLASRLMPVDIDIAKVARLARLGLTPEQLEAYGTQLQDILEHAARVQALDTDDVAPTAHVIPLATPLRADAVAPSLPPETAVANAPGTTPERDGSAFAVPPVLEGEEEG